MPFYLWNDLDWDDPGLSYWDEIDLVYFVGCNHMWN
jgi:hypothetical protein